MGTSDRPTRVRSTVRPVRVAVGGLPFFGRRIARLIDGDGMRAIYLETQGWSPRVALRALRLASKADLIYLIGGQVERRSRPHLLRLALKSPMVMHWAGSDVLYARGVVEAGRAAPALLDNVQHWSGAPWLSDELAGLGVTAPWLPHSWVESVAWAPELPAGPFTVVAYLPERRTAFYGAAVVRDVALALPDARMLVVGTSRLAGAPPNVHCLAWVEQMEEVYKQSHALLRMPDHDGLSFMVQEALALGRYAVWPYPFPGAILVRDASQAIAALRSLQARHEAGALPRNEAGAAETRERFGRERIRTDLRAALLKAVIR